MASIKAYFILQISEFEQYLPLGGVTLSWFLYKMTSASASFRYFLRQIYMKLFIKSQILVSKVEIIAAKLAF